MPRTYTMLQIQIVIFAFLFRHGVVLAMVRRRFGIELRSFAFWLFRLRDCSGGGAERFC